MADVVLDTNVLADLLAQFFAGVTRVRPHFVKQNTVSRKLARKVNQIVRWHDPNLAYEEDEELPPGKVVASTFAFVEIARGWTDIVRDRFQVYEMAAFIDQPPEWFVVEPVDENLVLEFCDVPPDILMADGRTRSLEWPDAVHVATAFGRGDNSLLATTDRELQRIEALQNRLV